MKVELQVKDLVTGYGPKPVLHKFSLSVQTGEIVVLVGHNGAGKSTALNAIFGAVPVWSGTVQWQGRVITGQEPSTSVRDGMRLVPEGTQVFADLSVAENLELGAYGSIGNWRAELPMVYQLFPKVKERLFQKAGTLSGGERKMLGIGMALLTKPRLLLLDEPSLGLAPALVQQVLETVRSIRDTFGTTIVLVEPNVRQALRVADRMCVVKVGQVEREVNPSEVEQPEDLWQLF